MELKRDRKCSETVKLAGFKNLRQLSSVCEVPETTLRDWYHKKQKLFSVVVLGCAKKIENGYQL